MTITLRQKDLENDNKSLYLDIYENGKRKFEFLSLYLIPEINQETKERNEATLKRAQEIRAERVLHPETIPEKGKGLLSRDYDYEADFSAGTGTIIISGESADPEQVL